MTFKLRSCRGSYLRCETSDCFHHFTGNRMGLCLFQGEISKSVVFLISFWGDQIGQKVQKICDW